MILQTNRLMNFEFMFDAGHGYLIDTVARYIC